MQLQDFPNLATAQAYSQVNQKMISPDMMVAFMTSFGHVSSIMNATTEQALGLKLALQFGSEFNLINGHPASVKSMLDQMVLDNLVSQAFVDYAIAYANPTTYPFLNATQADYDIVILKNTKALATSTTFDGGLDYQISTPNTQYVVSAILVNPAPIDLTINCYESHCPDGLDMTVPSNWVIDMSRPTHIIPIATGQTSASRKITKPMPRRWKLVCEGDANVSFSVTSESIK